MSNWNVILICSGRSSLATVTTARVCLDILNRQGPTIASSSRSNTGPFKNLFATRASNQVAILPLPAGKPQWFVSSVVFCVFLLFLFAITAMVGNGKVWPILHAGRAILMDGNPLRWLHATLRRFSSLLKNISLADHGSCHEPGGYLAIFWRKNTLDIPGVYMLPGPYCSSSDVKRPILFFFQCNNFSLNFSNYSFLSLTCIPLLIFWLQFYALGLVWAAQTARTQV